MIKYAQRTESSTGALINDMKNKISVFLQRVINGNVFVKLFALSLTLIAKIPSLTHTELK